MIFGGGGNDEIYSSENIPRADSYSNHDDVLSVIYGEYGNYIITTSDAPTYGRSSNNNKKTNNGKIHDTDGDNIFT